MQTDKTFQWVGGFLYAIAAAVAGGAIPVFSAKYAWVPAAIGVVMRNMSDSNATQATKPVEPTK